MTTTAKTLVKYHKHQSENQKMRQCAWLMLLLTGTILLMVGCQGVQYQPGKTFEDLSLQQELAGKIEAAYPQAFTVKQRVILSIKGNQITANQYAQISQPNAFRLVGIDDFGVTLYEVAMSSGEINVLRSMGNLPANLLTQGAGFDVANMYLADMSGKIELVKHDSGQVGLITRQTDGHIREYLFSGTELTLTGYRLIRSNRVVYKIEYSDRGTTPSWDRSTPKQATITHFGLGYVASIRIIDLKSTIGAKQNMM